MKKIKLALLGTAIMLGTSTAAWARSTGNDTYCTGPATTFDQWFSQLFLC